MRASATQRHSEFHQAFMRWRMPRPGQPPAAATHVADTLVRWLAERPRNAGLIQQMAAGAAAAAEAATDWPAVRGIAGAGLDAALVGALAEPQRLHATAALALLAARAEMEMAQLADARRRLAQAAEVLQQLDPGSAIGAYLRWQLDLLGGELSEAALERAAAAVHFERAARTADTLESDGQALQMLCTEWVEALYGELPPALTAQTMQQLANARADLRRRGVLGAVRVDGSAARAEHATQLCEAHGLPADEVLSMRGILAALPAARIDDVAQRLLRLADALDEPWRTHWHLALHTQQAEAWLDRGEVRRAGLALDAAARAGSPQSGDVALCLLLANRVRLEAAEDHGSPRPAQLDALLRAHALVVARLSGSRWHLPFRAACEPALQAAAHAQGRRLLSDPDDSAARRGLSLLIDALREPQTRKPPAGTAADRIGRLAWALAHDPALRDWLVLVFQRVEDGILLLAVGGNATRPVLCTPAAASLAAALGALDDSAVQAMQGQVDDGELTRRGRRAYDALDEAVRQRIAQARTLLVVPDFSAGLDHTPVELMHDGHQHLGCAKVVTRCLSLAHALNAVEAPLAVQPPGRHALCVQVSEPPGFAPLQHAATEAAAVREVLRHKQWDVAELDDTSAQPLALLQLLPLAHVVHIACHGEASAGAEALVLADGARLTALEFATRHPVRAVAYLNACALGRGRYLGGGVSRGMAYALARAGAPAVLANLSPVEDEQAAELAEAFYLAAHDRPVGEALRGARQLMQAIGGPAAWSATVLLGDPAARIGGDVPARADATAALLAGNTLPGARRLAAARRSLVRNPGDLRLAAALSFCSSLAQEDPARLEPMADLAREIGHPIGEARCLALLADALQNEGDTTRRGMVLTRAIAVLEPLRTLWEPARELHARLREELRALDPAHRSRDWPLFQLSSGMRVNDRSDPASAAVMDLIDAMHTHEAFWRGEPRLHDIDSGLASAAHNMTAWGYLHGLYGTGAEIGYAGQYAQRLAWRGLVPPASAPALGRILAGLLHFLWGQQSVKHLEHWMHRAHAQVILLALQRVPGRWQAAQASSAALAAQAITGALDQARPAAASGSRFARARVALRQEAPAAQAEAGPALAEAVGDAIERCRRDDPMASAELAAWVLGEVLQRIEHAEAEGSAHLDALNLYRSLFDALQPQEEAWFMPYLMAGFEDVRATGGRDLFDRWSQAMG